MSIPTAAPKIENPGLDVGFKSCPNCNENWQDRKIFLGDPKIGLVGYQVNFAHLDKGLFMFNHLTCETTMAIRVEKFKDLYDGPLFKKSKTGSEECPGYCLYTNEFAVCPAECECAYVREVIQIIKAWDKC